MTRSALANMYLRLKLWIDAVIRANGQSSDHLDIKEHAS
jgi:hypothetical protein